jgi:hypothetical protein
MADEKELGNVVSSMDMAAFLSEPTETQEGQQTDLFEDSTRREPEVVVEGQDRGSEATSRRDVAEVRGEEDSVQPRSDERLDQALRTIDRLTEERSQLLPKQQPLSTQSIEWMDTPWGIQIPKDPRMRFVQLEAQHLEPLGIDGSIAPGLNVLANAFWASIVNTIPQNTLRAMDEIQSRRSTDRERFTSFFDEYSDLKDHVELVQLIEHQARRGENLHQRFPGQEDYRREVSRRVRSKIAAMRGISLDQYEREVGTGNNTRTLRPRNAPVSRARSVGGGASGRGSTPRNNDIFSDTLYGG